MENSIQIQLKGMNCNHCTGSVERNLSKLEGVSDVKADLSSQVVELKSEDLDFDKVKSVVEDLGFEYIGKL